jgi:CRISPR-associated protein Csx3
MSKFNVELINDVLKIGFGDEPATNDQIVPEAVEKATTFRDAVAGKLLKINGAASLPVAVAITFKLAHMVPAVAVFDPKLKAYVVAITQDPQYKLGQLITENESTIASAS